MVVLGQKSVSTIHCLAKSYGVTPVSPMLEMAYRMVSTPLNFFQVSIGIKYEQKQGINQLKMNGQKKLGQP